MGVDTKKTPFEVAQASEVVITMLPSSSHVDYVYTGPNGLLRGGYLLRPWLLIDSSTIDPQTSRKLSATVSNGILKEKKNGEKQLLLFILGSVSERPAMEAMFSRFWFHQPAIELSKRYDITKQNPPLSIISVHKAKRMQ
ncbi:hypothetical protein FNV43_RR06371 [Rhamnella rubrinervis]|uniref:3-hydroxyisobutyrate dehydrogenase n=1 Tax=Rhamnella rubrinervis TaxID=2594499 RepID=A0A8K0ML85_9ROSA|nr:hypothetical protein FNV43_RR06371 [Rhamnella rubrinervis]